MVVDLDEQMNQFRIASRELFNHFFRIHDPWSGSGQQQQHAWRNEERFGEVQVALFEQLVASPLSPELDIVRYGQPQPNILVVPRGEMAVPIMLNQGRDTGSWGYPLEKMNKDSRLLFNRFFDWDQLGYKDNLYVRICVDSSPAHPDIVGKDGLIEAQYVRTLYEAGIISVWLLSF